jgi:hypothetical protein
VGFSLVIEAGLVSKPDDFRSLRVHTLPGRRTADEIWNDAPATDEEHVPGEDKRLKAAGLLDQWA